MMKSIKLFLFFQLLVLLTLAISKEFFLNFEVAFLTSIIVLQGSMYSYSRLVKKRVESESYEEEDALKKVDDPYDLYDDEEKKEEIIEDEKKRIKSRGAIKSTVSSSPALVSLFRIVPYIFLILGFIGLKNNQLLELVPYLSGLGVGVIAGFFLGKEFFL